MRPVHVHDSCWNLLAAACLKWHTCHGATVVYMHFWRPFTTCCTFTIYTVTHLWCINYILKVDINLNSTFSLYAINSSFDHKNNYWTTKHTTVTYVLIHKRSGYLKHKFTLISTGPKLFRSYNSSHKKRCINFIVQPCDNENWLSCWSHQSVLLNKSH